MKNPKQPALNGVALAFVALIPVITSLTLYRDFTGDDTFIHLVFARNIATGQGFAFNPGEPTYGASSPLWVLLLAASSLITHEFFWTARVMSLLFSICAVISVFAFAYRVTNRFAVSLGAAMAFAIDPHFAKFAFSGMETSLAISLVMISLYLHLRGVQGHRSSDCLLGGVLAVATLTRPECILLFGACLMDRLRRPSPKWLLALIRMGVVYLIIVGSWWLYAWHTFGTIIPNTAIAKSTTTSAWLIAACKSAFSLLQLVATSYGAILLLFFVGWGGAWFIKKRTWSGVPLAAALWCIAWLGIQVFKGVDIVARYVLLASPLLVVAAFEGAGRLWSALPKIGSRWFFFFLSLIVANSVVLTIFLIYPAAIEFSKGFEAAYIEMGQWLAEHTPPDTTVAVADIGAIGYFSHRRVFDLGGLVTPEAIPYMWGNQGRFVEFVRPDYLVIRRMGAPPVVEDWEMTCVQATPIMTRTFYAVGSRTLGIPHFSTLYKLTWLSPCSESPLP